MFVTETVRIVSTLFFYQSPQLRSPGLRLSSPCPGAVASG